MKLIEGEKYICITDNFYEKGVIIEYIRSFSKNGDGDIEDKFIIRKKGITTIVFRKDYNWDIDIILYSKYLRKNKLERITKNED
jgi:hypothetical protein